MSGAGAAASSLAERAGRRRRRRRTTTKRRKALFAIKEKKKWRFKVMVIFGPHADVVCQTSITSRLNKLKRINRKSVSNHR
jgi:hypothetical protein